MGNNSCAGEGGRSGALPGCLLQAGDAPLLCRGLAALPRHGMGWGCSGDGFGGRAGHRGAAPRGQGTSVPKEPSGLRETPPPCFVWSRGSPTGWAEGRGEVLQQPQALGFPPGTAGGAAAGVLTSFSSTTGSLCDVAQDYCSWAPWSLLLWAPAGAEPLDPCGVFLGSISQSQSQSRSQAGCPRSGSAQSRVLQQHQRQQPPAPAAQWGEGRAYGASNLGYFTESQHP